MTAAAVPARPTGTGCHPERRPATKRRNSRQNAVLHVFCPALHIKRRDNIASVTEDDARAALARAGYGVIAFSSRGRMTRHLPRLLPRCVRCAWCSSGRCSPTRASSSSILLDNAGQIFITDRIENAHHRHCHEPQRCSKWPASEKWIDKAMAQTEKLTSLCSTLSRLDEEVRRSENAQKTAETFVDFAASKGPSCAFRSTASPIAATNTPSPGQRRSNCIPPLAARRHRSSNACEDVARKTRTLRPLLPCRSIPLVGHGIGLSTIGRSIRAIVDDRKITFTAELK